jgi:hypothetical protein
VHTSILAYFRTFTSDLEIWAEYLIEMSADLQRTVWRFIPENRAFYSCDTFYCELQFLELTN